MCVTYISCYIYVSLGDITLADRGFLCQDYASLVMAEVKTPQFTKGKRQLEKKEVDWSRELSAVRIHIERVISVLNKSTPFCKVFFLSL